MSLRLLERCTRFWGAQAATLQPPAACRRRPLNKGSAGSRAQQAGSLHSPEKEWTLLDLGTGSGILALAAARFGAKRVIAIDDDPVAIATARENARRNKLDNIDFRFIVTVSKSHPTVGATVNKRTNGETIRDTFADYIAGETGKVTYFEPALLTAIQPDQIERDLKLWAEFSDTDEGILEKVIEYPAGTKVEKTLVLIKPDNFKFPNLRPGGVIEVFSRTGLYIIGFKVHRMSVAQAEEFYGPVLRVLEEKLGTEKGRGAWGDIVEFMSGGRPSQIPSAQKGEPGTEKCIAIVYQGEDAAQKIREVLGPTDPSKAPPGSIRKEFGQTIMINAAHASDSIENAQREMKIVQVDENNFKPLIDEFYRQK